MKPYSAACDQNREVILQTIRPLLTQAKSVLEIGSGTGQHAVYFGEHLPHLQWYTSDLAAYHTGIQQWLNEAALSNVHAPLTLDVEQEQWPAPRVDAVFSANALHIMHRAAVKACIAGVGRLLAPQGLWIVYGPFNYDGQYTSESNAQFDNWLKMRDPGSGIRHFEEVDQLAQEAGLMLYQDTAMPANNRLLCWKKLG